MALSRKLQVLRLYTSQLPNGCWLAMHERQMSGMTSVQHASFPCRRKVSHETRESSCVLRQKHKKQVMCKSSAWHLAGSLSDCKDAESNFACQVKSCYAATHACRWECTAKDCQPKCYDKSQTVMLNALHEGVPSCTIVVQSFA